MRWFGVVEIKQQRPDSDFEASAFILLEDERYLVVVVSAPKITRKN
jgi:hypothetical protein